MRKFLSLLLFLIGYDCSQAQDPHFSQFFANPVYLNPAYAGFDKGTTFTLNSRDQWFGLPDGSQWPGRSGFRTYNATVNQQLPCVQGSEWANFGLALSAFGDYAGSAPLKTQGIGLAISYEQRLIDDRKYRLDLRAGGQYSRMWKSLDGENLIYTYQLDPLDGFRGDTQNQIFQSDGYSNGNIGMLLRGRWRKNKHIQHLFTLGYSISNVNRPNISLLDGASLTKLNQRHTIYTGFTLMIKEYVGTKPPWYIAPQFRLDWQRIREEGPVVLPNKYLSSATLGAYLFWSKSAYAGAFVQWNPGRRIEQNMVDIINNNFARNNTLLSLTVGADPRSLKRKGRRNNNRINQILLAISYDIQLTGLPNQSTIGVFELSGKINLNKRNPRRCNDIARFELYDGGCPVKF